MPGQQTLNQAFNRCSMFSRNDGKQIAINASIVDDLIVDLCLPIYMVDMEKFWKMDF